MKTRTMRGLVVVFAMATLGGMAIAPRSTYGLNAGDGDNTDAQRRIEAQRAYNDAYNRAFEQARAAEQQKLDDEGSKEEGGCCG